MGRLIPAGTGLAAYKTLNVVVEGEPVERALRAAAGSAGTCAAAVAQRGQRGVSTSTD